MRKKQTSSKIRPQHKTSLWLNEPASVLLIHLTRPLFRWQTALCMAASKIEVIIKTLATAHKGWLVDNTTVTTCWFRPYIYIHFGELWGIEDQGLPTIWCQFPPKPNNPPVKEADEWGHIWLSLCGSKTYSFAHTSCSYTCSTSVHIITILPLLDLKWHCSECSYFVMQ